jgi:hypothetical protein
VSAPLLGAISSLVSSFVLEIGSIIGPQNNRRAINHDVTGSAAMASRMRVKAFE